LVFIIPFAYFLIKKRLDASTIKKCAILLFMGGFQGFLGWFMVKSGLIDNPDVSHYRLALHLTFAFLTFSYTLWVALDLIYPQKQTVFTSLRNLARVALVFLIFQIIYGGFVAGMNAGLIHNHWPMMSEGKYMHETVLIEKPTLFLNLVEGKSGIQFVHRNLAYVVVGLMLFLVYKSRKFILVASQKRGLNTLVIFVFMQFTLGVVTLLLHVPLWLGLAHQAMAFLLLASMVYTLHRLSK
jgi:cytochrome c oxidase assembly protein subunit 15